MYYILVWLYSTVHVYNHQYFCVRCRVHVTHVFSILLASHQLDIMPTATACVCTLCTCVLLTATTCVHYVHVDSACHCVWSVGTALYGVGYNRLSGLMFSLVLALTLMWCLQEIYFEQITVFIKGFSCKLL